MGLPLGAPSSGPQAKRNLRPPDPNSPGAPALRCIESASAMSVLVSACLKADAESFMHTSASDLGTVLEMLRSLCPPSEPKVSPHRASQVLHRHSFPSLVLLFSVGATWPGSYSGKQMRMLLSHHLPGMQEVRPLPPTPQHRGCSQLSDPPSPPHPRPSIAAARGSQIPLLLWAAAGSFCRLQQSCPSPYRRLGLSSMLAPLEGLPQTRVLSLLFTLLGKLQAL